MVIHSRFLLGHHTAICRQEIPVTDGDVSDHGMVNLTTWFLLYCSTTSFLCCLEKFGKKPLEDYKKNWILEFVKEKSCIDLCSKARTEESVQ